MTMKDTLFVSEEYYHISGSVELVENNYAIVKPEEPLEFNIDGKSYETDKIYLAQNISFTEDSIDVSGRICKLDDNVFMLIENNF